MISQGNISIFNKFLFYQIGPVIDPKMRNLHEIMGFLLKIQLYFNRPISQTVFMLSIAINRAEHVCATVIIEHNYMLMCNHKIVINIMLCLLNSTGHI